MCRHCGASDECGWDDETLDGGYSAEEDFDYDEFVAREFQQNGESASAAASRNWGVRLVILAILVSWLLILVL